MKKHAKVKDDSAAKAVMESINNPRPFVKGTPRPESQVEKAPGEVEVGIQRQTAEQALAVKQEIKFKDLSVEVITATMEVGKKYLNLCSYIRAEKIAPKQVTQWLLDLGFAKTRASEVNRVAQAPDEVFSQLQARALSWKGALDLARGGDELKQALLADKEAIEVVGEVVREAVAAEESESSDDKPASAATLLKEYRAALDRHAIALLKLVAARKGKSVRAEKWDLGSGWTLALVPSALPKGTQDTGPVTKSDVAKVHKTVVTPAAS